MRRLELDFLRLIAVVLVLGRHMHGCPETTSPTVSTLTNYWQTGGWIGVDLFFVLSGFLVSGLLFREYRKHIAIDARRFLYRRAFKIYPSFWALTAVTVVVLSLTRTEFGLRNLLSELLFLQNYCAPIWNHTWSLAVEEHFYLLLTGLLCWLVAGHRGAENPFRQIPRLFVMTATICLLLRLLTAGFSEFSVERQLFATHLRIDSLLFGTLLAYDWEFGGHLRSADVKRNRWNLILTGGLLLSPAFVFPVESTPWVPVIGVTLFYLGSGAILVGALHCRLSSTSVLAPLAALGGYSYSIYLWHMPAHQWVTPAILRSLPVTFSENWWMYATVYFLSSFVGGVALCKLIEIPCLCIRDRMFPSQTEGVGINRTAVAIMVGGMTTSDIVSTDRAALPNK